MQSPTLVLIHSGILCCAYHWLVVHYFVLFPCNQEYLLGLLEIMTRSTDQLISIFNKLSAPVSNACLHQVASIYGTNCLCSTHLNCRVPCFSITLNCINHSGYMLGI